VSRVLRATTIAAAALVLFTRTLHGQLVGHSPAESPYRDIGTGMRIGVFTGWYLPKRDIARVLPKSGPIFGARWEAHLGGPADFAGKVATVLTKRDVIDPSKPAGARFVEERSVTLTYADVGISVNLTGNKSWQSLVPFVFGTVGTVSDFSSRDIGGFKHGSTFAFGFGGGLRYVPLNSPFQVRTDIGSSLYSLQYPITYYQFTSDGTSVLRSDVKRAQWRNNLSITLGAVYEFRR
jgi:hypothetical protein